MKKQDLLIAICGNPESDALRLEYANEITASDPEHAEFIRLQIAIAALRRQHARASSDRRIWPYFPKDEDRASVLLRKNRGRWAEGIARFTRRLQLVEFDRGFPTCIEMQPHVFVADAGTVFETAPIRHINFTQPLDERGHLARTPKGDLVPFPIDQLLGCPQLAHLDSIGFAHAALEPSRPPIVGTAAKIAQCPHLIRCLHLTFILTLVSERDLVALAEGPLTGRMFGISIPNVGECAHIERGKQGGDYLVTDFSSPWRDVEHRLGYIPWLHPSHNGVDRLDVRWHLENGGAPRYPAGSRPIQDAWYEIERLCLTPPKPAERPPETR